MPANTKAYIRAFCTQNLQSKMIVISWMFRKISLRLVNAKRNSQWDFRVKQNKPQNSKTLAAIKPIRMSFFLYYNRPQERAKSMITFKANKNLKGLSPRGTLTWSFLRARRKQLSTTSRHRIPTLIKTLSLSSWSETQISPYLRSSQP